MRLLAVLSLSFVAFFCGCTLFESHYGSDVKAPARLRVENMENPVGIDAVKPRMGWVLKANGNRENLKQFAYQVMVADSADKLIADQGNLWDSGRIISDKQFNVIYGGKPLASSQRCYWKVRVWVRCLLRTVTACCAIVATCWLRGAS